MNRLQKDIRLYRRAWRVCVASVFILGITKLLQLALGPLESGAYQMYPAGHSGRIALGVLPIAAVVYCLKKAYDIHPNIQLRNKPDDVLKGMLEDPDYTYWHDEAKRLLEKRKNKRAGGR